MTSVFCNLYCNTKADLETLQYQDETICFNSLWLEMSGPKQMLWNVFLHGSACTLEHHRQQEKCSCFPPI